MQSGATQDLNARLSEALAGGFARDVKELLALGASVAAQEGRDPPLFVALWGDRERDNRLACCELLLKAGADPNAVDLAGTPALVGAVRAGAAPCALLLLEFGASVAAKDRSGASAADEAMAMGDMNTLARLLEAGAKMEDLAKKLERWGRGEHHQRLMAALERSALRGEQLKPPSPSNSKGARL